MENVAVAIDDLGKINSEAESYEMNTAIL